MKLDTTWPADSVEFCPHPKASNIVVCGTYFLCDTHPEVPSSDVDGEPAVSSSPQRRRGKCIVLDVSNSSTQPQIKEELEFSAVPDMKWSYHHTEKETHLAIAESEGRIVVARWNIDSSRMEILQRIESSDPGTLCLSLDWSNRVNKEIGRLITSRSDGSVQVLQYSDSGDLVPQDAWHAHDFESWIAAWDYWDTNVCYSGGDDLALKGWDIRASSKQPTFINKRFGGGVTTIQSNPHYENVLAVGSYDESVRVFDTRNLRSPISETPVGGGVWRVKWHPSSSRRTDLLTACMHDGFKVVHFSDDWASSDTIKHFEEHTSLAYGVDWYHGALDNDGRTLVASCSFYDHVLHTWAG
ncbi:WD40 repeat-like protein [Schizopora paradoxa]|uniref:methylated diphthine methylhydrolase n=1 Tax=Schizopora paradoxa TaxID=27342 RepID=A0A0H2RY97_9AGAM|nr:WD40 repeat-like protein [Schizopora paradoxa]